MRVLRTQKKPKNKTCQVFQTTQSRVEKIEKRDKFVTPVLAIPVLIWLVLPAITYAFSLDFLYPLVAAITDPSKSFLFLIPLLFAAIALVLIKLKTDSRKTKILNSYGVGGDENKYYEIVSKNS